MVKLSFKNPFSKFFSSEADDDDDVQDQKKSRGHHSPRVPRRVHFTPSTKPQSSPNTSQEHRSNHTPRTPRPAAAPASPRVKPRAPQPPLPPRNPKSKARAPALPRALPEAPAPPRNPNPISRPSPHDLPLSLSTLWYTHWPPTPFPPPHLSALPHSKRLISQTQKAGTLPENRRISYFAATLQFQDLKRTKLHLTWDPKDAKNSVKVKQRHYFPTKLSPAELETARGTYSEGVARYCEGKMGRVVGNGECWTLARDALVAVGEKCKSRNVEACFESCGVVHGYLILSLPLSSYSFTAAAASAAVLAAMKEAAIGRGDIIQFSSAVFKMATPTESRTVKAGTPDHTAVIMAVRGTRVLALEQSGGDRKGVRRAEYEFDCLKSGGLKVFRAVGEKWGKGVETR